MHPACWKVREVCCLGFCKPARKLKAWRIQCHNWLSPTVTTAGKCALRCSSKIKTFTAKNLGLQYMAYQGLLKVEIKLRLLISRVQDRDIILGYLSEPNVIMRTLHSRRRGKREKCSANDWKSQNGLMIAERSEAKVCEDPLEQDETTDFSFCFQEETHTAVLTF
ncbi:fatty acid-binding protein 5 isoform X1 [Fukomys damarensis]|uniref:fatty acid-binding protein 5 isoform X1 n=1 Tax=Fukomys damarensis TaxID=885580 RepID=UPI001455324C|nr:fatty acid-binding protein 5 isoform X1 [Fukomys damarensis]